MIKITVETSQKELINTLSNNLNEFGDLYLQVATLPYFLSSIPSIRVFQYKINNYPRNIFWYSLDHKILNFLKQSELSIGFPTTLIDTKKETITHSFNTIKNSSFKPLDNHILGTKAESPIIGDKPNLLIEYKDLVAAEKIHQLEYKNTPIDDLFNQNSVQGYEPNIPAAETVSTESFLSKFKSKFELNPAQKISFSQNFDDMISRVEKTKSTIKTENTRVTKAAEQVKNTFLELLVKYKIRFNTVLSFGLVLVLVGIFNIFPKNVFNLEVSSGINQKTIEVKIPETQLKKTKVELKSTTQIQTANQLPNVKITNGNQKVNLVNSSSGTIRFDRGGIILIAEKTGVEYRQKITIEDPISYSIAAQSKAKFIDIQAVKQVEDLPNDSILKVFNLKGDALGFNFKAVVVDNEINVPKQSIFSESDQDTLKTKIDSDLNEKRSSFINSLNDENNFTSSAWYNIISTEIKYDKDLNQKADIVNAEAVSVIEVYSVPRSDFKNTIEVKSNLGKVMDIEVMDSKIEGEKDKLINSRFLVTYQENTPINKKDLVRTLSRGDINQVQEQFPSVKRISTESKTGFSFPGIAPIDQIKILDRNSK